MLITGLTDYDISSYKIPALFISFPKCNFKCGASWCQNYHLKHSNLININLEIIKDLYEQNPLTHAFVLGGLEPFDTQDELLTLISNIRTYTLDPIVIYTGYTEEELQDILPLIIPNKNIIIKFGRYIPNSTSHFDDILGVELASDNQYGKQYT